LSASATKESVTEAKSANEEKDRDKTRGEIEVLILVSGLIMTPLLYLWQQSLAIEQVWLPQWQSYLTSQLGSQSNSGAVTGAYFTSFGLMQAVPVDLMLWTYDISIILIALALTLFGAALVAIEKSEVQRVRRLVQSGRRCLSLVMVFIIFFVVTHLLATTIFPFRLLVGEDFPWVILGVALATAIVMKKLVNRYINKALA